MLNIHTRTYLNSSAAEIDALHLEAARKLFRHSDDIVKRTSHLPQVVGHGAEALNDLLHTRMIDCSVKAMYLSGEEYQRHVIELVPVDPPKPESKPAVHEMEAEWYRSFVGYHLKEHKPFIQIRPDDYDAYRLAREEHEWDERLKLIRWERGPQYDYL